ncbi:MAG: hypothetical protein MR357_00645 [Anaeroplasma sp.]|nr:hypothetical protein [Anaeroplasma sp.]
MKNYPVANTNKNHIKHRNKPKSSRMPVVQPNSMFTSGTPNGIFTTGQTGNRNFMGKVVRKVYMRNANGEVMIMTDSNDFINVSKGMCAEMRNGNQRRNRRFGR